MFLLDKNGVILYMGIPGSNKYFSADAISSIVNKLKKEDTNDYKIKGLKIVNVNKVRDKNLIDFELKQPFAARINKVSKSIIVSSLVNNTVYLIDSNNILQREILIDNYGISRHSLVQGNISNDDIYIYSVSPECSGVIYKLDVSNNRCDSLIKCMPLIPENTLPYFSVKKKNDSTFYINQMPFNYDKISGTEPTIRSYSFSQTHYNGIGSIDPIYKKYFLSNYFCTEFCFDNDENIYEYQNFSDSIYFYSKGLKIGYPANFDSTYYNYSWESLLDGVSQETDIEIRKTFRFKVSSLMYSNAIIYDEINDEIVIFYGHNMIDNDKQKIYLHRFNKFEANKKRSDVCLPDDCTVVGLENGVLTLLRNINGKSFIVDYMLK